MKAHFNVRNVDEGQYKLTINSKDVYVHPNYEFELSNDIALIKTPQKLGGEGSFFLSITLKSLNIYFLF